MQLKASHPSNILFIPTLDIEIVWQTHLLRPEIYQADCLRLFHRVIDHSLLISDIEDALKEQAFRDTCQLYEQRFGEQYCSLQWITETKKTVPNFPPRRFDLDRDVNPAYSYWDRSYFKFLSTPSKDYENPFSFTEGDLIMDGKWLDFCKQFMTDALKKAPISEYHRVKAGEINLESGAIQRLTKSYERFLYMAAKYPLKDGNGFIPPTYAVQVSNIRKVFILFFYLDRYYVAFSYARTIELYSRLYSSCWLCHLS